MKNKKILLLDLIFCFCIACGFFSSDEIKENIEPFYQDKGGYDFLRLPLMQPYFAIKGDDKLGWCVDLLKSPSMEATYYISIKRIEKFAVKDEMLFIETKYVDESTNGLQKEPLFWFVLIPNKEIEKGFSNQKDFLDYIQIVDPTEIKWLDPDVEYQYFERNGCLTWIPECKFKN